MIMRVCSSYNKTTVLWIYDFEELKQIGNYIQAVTETPMFLC
jgi:hypothetical protein